MSKVATFSHLRAIDRIDRGALKAGPAEVLRFIERRQRQGQWHFVTVAAMAACLKMGQRTVTRHIATLREAGLLAVWNRVAGHRKIASGYRVLLRTVNELAEAGRDLAAQAAARARAAMRAAVVRIASGYRQRSRAALQCANLAYSDRQEDVKDGEKRRLYALLASGGLSLEDQEGAWERLAQLEA